MARRDADPGLLANLANKRNTGEAYSPGAKQNRTLLAIIDLLWYSKAHPMQNAPWGWTAYIVCRKLLFVVVVVVVVVAVSMLSSTDPSYTIDTPPP